MNENKLNLTDIDLLIEESKKINFSSESEVRNLGIKYPENFKEVGSLNENSLIEYFKINENYKQSKEIDPKTLLIKRKIYYTDLGNGKELKNLPGWKAIKDNNISQSSHYSESIRRSKNLFRQTNIKKISQWIYSYYMC